MDLHILLGQIMLGLVLFRIFWGLIGSSTARFAGFVRGPARDPSPICAARQAGDRPQSARRAQRRRHAAAARRRRSGSACSPATRTALYQGPLSHHVSFETAETLAERHETMFNVLLVFIGLHLAAILFYALVKRDNLIAPMITGGREGAAGEAPMVAGAGLALPRRRRRSRSALTLWIATGL